MGKCRLSIDLTEAVTFAAPGDIRMALAALITASYGQIGLTVGLFPPDEEPPKTDQDEADQSWPPVSLWLSSHVFSSGWFYHA